MAARQEGPDRLPFYRDRVAAALLGTLGARREPPAEGDGEPE